MNVFQIFIFIHTFVTMIHDFSNCYFFYYGDLCLFKFRISRQIIQSALNEMLTSSLFKVKLFKILTAFANI